MTKTSTCIYTGPGTNGSINSENKVLLSTEKAIKSFRHHSNLFISPLKSHDCKFARKKTNRNSILFKMKKELF